MLSDTPFTFRHPWMLHILSRLELYMIITEHILKDQQGSSGTGQTGEVLKDESFLCLLFKAPSHLSVTLSSSDVGLQNSNVGTDQNSNTRTPKSEPRYRNSNVETPMSRLQSQNSKVRTPISEHKCRNQSQNSYMDSDFMSIIIIHPLWECIKATYNLHLTSKQYQITFLKITPVTYYGKDQL